MISCAYCSLLLKYLSSNSNSSYLIPNLFYFLLIIHSVIRMMRNSTFYVLISPLMIDTLLLAQVMAMFMCGMLWYVVCILWFLIQLYNGDPILCFNFTITLLMSVRTGLFIMIFWLFFTIYIFLLLHCIPMYSHNNFFMLYPVTEVQ